MNCSKCGKVLNPGENVCTNCGNVINPVPVQEPVQNIPAQEPVQPMPNQNPGVVNPAPVQMPVQEPAQPMPSSGVVNPMPAYNQPMPEQPKKNNTFIIIAAILGVIIIGLIVFLIVRNTGGEKDNPVGEGGGTNEPSSQVEQSTNNNNNNTISSNVTKYSGYELIIPEEYTVTGESDGLLNIVDYVNELSIGVGIDKTFSYNNIISDKEAFVNAYKSEGVNTGSYYEKTYSGRKWFIVEVDGSPSYSGVIAHTAIGDNVFMLIIVSAEKTNYDSTIVKFSSVVSSAKESGVSGFAYSEESDINVAAKFNEMISE